MDDKLKTKEQLIEEIKALKIFVHAIPDIIYEVDTNWKFTFVSEAIRQFGYTPEELIGKPFKEIIHPDDFENVVRAIILPKYKGKKTGNAHAPKLFDERRTQYRMTKHLEVRLLLKNRERDYCYCEVHSSGKWDRPVSAKDKKLLGSFGIIRDITHRKQIEEELKRAYKELKSRQIQLIQAEKMAGIGQLAASTAHEINNPLSGIIGNLRILKEDYLDKCLDMISQLDIDKFREFKEDFEKNFPTHIEDSLRCAEHIKDVVTQLLAFSRPEEGRPMEEVDINSEIDKSLTFVSHELKSKCEVIKDFQPLPKVLAHPRQLDQVFINILTNASQAIDDKGHISIKTYLKAPYIFIEFTDDGKGIPKEQLSKIFEPFFTTKEVGKGTGLGLAITYEIIKNHNGRIDVRSEIGKGTTFTIKLPVKNTSFLLA